jgi:hypothetical protein
MIKFEYGGGGGRKGRRNRKDVARRVEERREKFVDRRSREEIRHRNQQMEPWFSRKPLSAIPRANMIGAVESTEDIILGRGWHDSLV